MKSIPEFDDFNLRDQFRLSVQPEMELDNYVEEIEIDYDKLRKELAKKLKLEFAVVGVDIYKYSEYGQLEQTLIPHLFKSLYYKCNNLIVQNFKYLFQHDIDASTPTVTDSLVSRFIDTGDGGFQILENPIKGLIWVIVFEAIVRLYNSRHFKTKLFDLIGPITLRFALTYDSVYHFANNYYGPGIINNSRIISKDHLNRFLIDDNTFRWFQRNCYGIENMPNIGLKYLCNLPDFQGYDDKEIDDQNNEVIYPLVDRIRKEGIKAIDVQKIEKINNKGMELSVYNICVQAHTKFGHFMQTNEIEFTYTIGNQNAQGLD
jgi:hypothetical protein